MKLPTKTVKPRAVATGTRKTPRYSSNAHNLEKYENNVRNRYATCGTRIDDTVNFTDALVITRAEEMADRYLDSIDTGRHHISNLSLPDKDSLVRYFAGIIQRQAMKFNAFKADNIAMSAEIRELVDKYATSKDKRGRVIAFLLATEYGTEDDNYDFLDEVEQDSYVEVFGDIDEIQFNALGFADFSNLYPVEYRSEHKRAGTI